MLDNKSIALTKLDEANRIGLRLFGQQEGFSGAEELACKYFCNGRQRDRGQDKFGREKAIDNLIKWQVMAAGASEFVTGIGGLMTLPVAIPANDVKPNKGLIITCAARD